ncbi:MAG TPA: PucR family transcriptional regulator ligand-binding domain-containing protein [Negativicutes bacterium]|nr:PucR family transcriptional regulator ligand-binding domain-containing protein [Negativicutes bacterium]
MSVTVADCLKLTALREAKVMAGSGGLDKIVTAVTVLEYADYSVLVDGLFIGNEIIITAFVSIKDDVEAQCKIISRIAEMGEVGLILYYVGIFVPEIDQRLIDTANELEFPLICMPQDRFDFRYSEVISEIYEMIFKDRMNEQYFVPGVLEQISQLQQRQRTADAVLRMLSDRLRCTLLICDRRYELQSNASWPMAARWDYEEFLNRLKESTALRTGQVLPMELGGTQVYISRLHIKTDNKMDIELIAIDETGMLPQDELNQAAEVVQLFFNIWKYNFEHEGLDALVQAILNNEPARMRNIAAALHFDIKSINTMWVLKDTEEGLTAEEQRNRNARRVIMTKLFLQDHRKLCLVDTFENNVVVFMNSPVFAELDKGLADDFLEYFRGNDSSLVLAIYNELETTTDVRNAYLLIESVFSSAGCIYPYHRILGGYEFKFTETCLAISKSGEEAVEKITSVLKPLRSHEDAADLIKTLTVFLLDAQNNLGETGNKMFLHKNTVKYRINKIKQRLGYELSKMPEAYNLYMAVALNRLLKNQ